MAYSPLVVAAAMASDSTPTVHDARRSLGEYACVCVGDYGY